MFEAADPVQISGAAALVPRSRGETLPAGELLKRAAAELDKRDDLDPDTRAFLRERLGSSFLAVGDRRRAVPLLTAAVRALEAKPDANAAALASAYQSLGWTGFITGDYDAARVAFERALAANRRMPPGTGTDLKRTAIQLQYAVVLSQTDEVAKAKDLAKEAVAGRAAINGENDPSMAEAHFGLAMVLMEANEIVPAAAQFVKGERIVKTHLPNDPLANTLDLFQKGVVTWLVLNNPEGAVKSLQEARRLVDQGPTRRSVYSLFVIGQLGIIQDAAGQRADAVATLKEAFDVAKDLDVLTHPKALFLVRLLGRLLSRGPTKDEAAARATIGEWLDAHRARAPDAPGYADALTIASETYRSLGDAAAERAALAEARAIYDRHPEAARRQINWINLHWLGLRHADDGRWADAEAAYRRAALAAARLDMRRLDADDRALNAVAWADAAARQGKYPDDARKELEARLAFGKTDLTGVRVRLARFRAHAGEPGPAADLLRAAVRGSKDPTELFDAARDLARLAGKADPAARAALVDDAAAALEKAARNGFRNAKAALAADAFGPFAEHPKVKEAVDRMRAKAKG
jgi:tetratricopeptide (TPR) repeat protein